jgi:hypothetical protein
VEEIERLLGCDVRVGASWAGLAVPRPSWELPLNRRDPILRALLERQADGVAPPASPMTPLERDVRRVLAPRLAKGEADIDVVARDLAMLERAMERACHLSMFNGKCSMSAIFRFEDSLNIEH